VVHPSFGPIVASLRKNHFELTTGRSWSQKTLADRIGVSSRLIKSIEQGAKQSVDVETLTKLADAFQLTTLERREFFALAAGVTDQQLMPNPPPPDAILPPPSGNAACPAATCLLA
jgi:transcriptional regulator with XRE-family HTH domain